jgi:AcrR family transcriptional regulator
MSMGRKHLGEIRRREIIEAFYEVAKQIGLENSSIAKVGQYMGISNGLIMHYFKTKDDLIFGLNEFILDQHLEIFEKNSPIIASKQDLEATIRELFSRKWNQYFDDGVFYSCYALIYRKKEFNQSFKQYLLNLHDALYKNLQQAKQDGIITNDNIVELTEILFALIDGSYYYMGMFEENDEKYQRQLDIYMNHCLELFTFKEM